MSASYKISETRNDVQITSQPCYVDALGSILLPLSQEKGAAQPGRVVRLIAS
jgi:hypothetical protein